MRPGRWYNALLFQRPAEQKLIRLLACQVRAHILQTRDLRQNKARRTPVWQLGVKPRSGWQQEFPVPKAGWDKTLTNTNLGKERVYFNLQFQVAVHH